MTPEQEERLIVAIEGIGEAFDHMAGSIASIADNDKKRFDKRFPKKKRNVQATVTHVKTDEERLKESQGQTNESLKNWVTLKEEDLVPAKRNGSKITLNPKKKYSQAFFEASLIKLNIDLDEVNRCAPITAILKEAEGGLPAVLDAMRFSQDPTIVKFLRAYELGNEIDHHIMPWEAWTVKARVDPSALLGSILIALRQQAVNTIKIVSITTHPDVVRATVKNALTPKGFKDRESLHTALGFLPRPKGTTFIEKYFAGTVGSEAGDGEEKPPEGTPPAPTPARADEVDMDDLFPNVELTQGLIGDGN